jgi:hypothetical protein
VCVAPMQESNIDRALAGKASVEGGRGSGVRRVNRALASMSPFSATAILTGVAIFLALALHTVIEIFFYAAVQPATLIGAAVVTILVATPIIANNMLVPIL